MPIANVAVTYCVGLKSFSSHLHLSLYDSFLLVIVSNLKCHFKTRLKEINTIYILQCMFSSETHPGY